jgi:hypothetical protein
VGPTVLEADRRSLHEIVPASLRIVEGEAEIALEQVDERSPIGLRASMAERRNILEDGGPHIVQTQIGRPQHLPVVAERSINQSDLQNNDSRDGAALGCIQQKCKAVFYWRDLWA